MNRQSPVRKRVSISNKQSGVALIVVLMLLAIMAAIAATMSERLTLGISRSAQKIDHQQAYWYAVGVEQLAKYGIEESFSDSDTVNLSQPWALDNQVFPLDYGEARGRMVDLQACFNLNGLAQLSLDGSENQRPYLMLALIELLKAKEVDEYQAEVIVDSLYEYLDGDSSVVTLSGVEESSYEALTPAYLTPNGLLSDESELRAIYQVDRSVMSKMRQLVCALPTDQYLLNVNTVREWQAPLIEAMFVGELSSDNALQIIQNRPFDGWGSVDDFMQESAIDALNSDIKNSAKAHFSVDSGYFELDGEVIVGDSRMRVRSLFFSNDKQSVQVVRRRFGGIVERISDPEAE
jgi:general secretion pathway protein K